MGAEEMLGIITAAVLKIFPQVQVTALAAVQISTDALRLLSLAQQCCGAMLTGFELMSDLCLQLVAKHFPQPSLTFFAECHPQYVLMDLSDSEPAPYVNTLLETVIGADLEQEICQDAVLTTSTTQSCAL